MIVENRTSSGKTYKLTRLLRDGAIMVVLLAGFMLLQTEIRKQLSPLYQDGASETSKGELAALYRVNSLGYIQNDPGATSPAMPMFQDVDEFDKISPAAGDE